MSIQSKILTGIGVFVAILLLTGWIVINEQARMDVFTQQWQGRSIEKGAEIFTSACATCHGLDGKGSAGVAPALNNPMLFAKDNPAAAAAADLKVVEDQQAALQKAQADYDEALAKRDVVKTQISVAFSADTKKELQAELDRLEGIIRNYDPKTPDKIAELAPKLTEAQAALDQWTAQGWDPTRTPRLVEMGWTSSLHDYLKSTVMSGRPNSKFYWPQAMPAWSQNAGGPLRDDEIENVVSYILNYQAEAENMSPSEIRQNFKNPADPAVLEEVIASGGVKPSAPIGDKSIDELKQIDWTGGDAAKGERLYVNNGCSGCHQINGGAAFNGASTAGTFKRVQDLRLKDPKNQGLTVEQYLAVSITHPAEYVVPGLPAGVMPTTFAATLTEQNIKDIIAYLATQ